MTTRPLLSVFELWHQRKLQERDIAHLRTFGCLAWALNRSNPKFGAEAERCILLGYPEGVKGYRLFSLKRKKILISRDVRFQESIFPFKLSTEKALPEPDLSQPACPGGEGGGWARRRGD